MGTRAGVSAAESTATCAVCFCDLPGDPSRWETPNCKHHFCTKCILTWVKESNTCPCCRENVVGGHRRSRRARGNASGAGGSQQEQDLAPIVAGIMKYGAIFSMIFLIAPIVAALFVALLDLLFRMLVWVLLLITPLYFLAVSTLPPDSAFEAKRELKRVVRGDHLQANHPERPRSWLAKTAARVAATVGIEIASVGGYTQEVKQFYGVAKLVVVKLESVGQRFYW
eukprot:CAMPEP_0118943870 /NCGR_PEP_ID=MMETSP1169-20130426/39211_1 /TAXON_ID=36882 /ORGANISM="Pyramimonas obovata, Strain CCMP722" /LENGTH=225 /DNA_ID=CAMNT_0006889227 /DNA_START=34 /DNA_END=708 /DNA_ORIENTATION=+